MKNFLVAVGIRNCARPLISKNSSKRVFAVRWKCDRRNSDPTTRNDTSFPSALQDVAQVSISSCNARCHVDIQRKQTDKPGANAADLVLQCEANVARSWEVTSNHPKHNSCNKMSSGSTTHALRCAVRCGYQCRPDWRHVWQPWCCKRCGQTDRRRRTKPVSLKPSVCRRGPARRRGVFNMV